MVYGLKYASETTNSNAFDWLEANLDLKMTHSLGLTLNCLKALVSLHNRLLDHLLAFKCNLPKNDPERPAVDYYLQNN